MKSSELTLNAVYMVKEYGTNRPAVFAGFIEVKSDNWRSSKTVKKATVKFMYLRDGQYILNPYSETVSLAAIQYPIEDDFETHQIKQQMWAAQVKLAEAEQRVTTHKFNTLLVKRLGENSGKIDVKGKRVSVELTLEELERLLAN